MYLSKIFLSIITPCIVLLNCAKDNPITYKQQSLKEYNILFLGTSLVTAFIDIPGIFQALSQKAGFLVNAEVVKDGSFYEHLNSPISMDKLNESTWDYVVVTESSFIASSPERRLNEMYPYAHILDSLIRHSGAQTVLYLQCAYRDDIAVHYQLGSYETMQNALVEGYLEIGNELDAPIAPIGPASQTAMERYQNEFQEPLNPWWQDGIHPIMKSAYLAACVLFSVIFQDSPERIAFYGEIPDNGNFALQTYDLDENIVYLFQKIAAETVLNSLDHWNIRILAQQ